MKVLFSRQMLKNKLRKLNQFIICQHIIFLLFSQDKDILNFLSLFVQCSFIVSQPSIRSQCEWANYKCLSFNGTAVYKFFFQVFYILYIMLLTFNTKEGSTFDPSTNRIVCWDTWIICIIFKYVQFLIRPSSDIKMLSNEMKEKRISNLQK